MRTVAACMLCAAGAAFAMEVHWRIKAQQLELRLASAQVDAQLAEQTTTRLLSNGRWVRDYDAKTGASAYRFAPRKERQ